MHVQVWDPLVLENWKVKQNDILFFAHFPVLPLKEKSCMHCFLLSLVLRASFGLILRAPLSWIWSRIVLPFLPHLCVCPSWLSGSGLLAGCWCSRIKTQCPAFEASNRITRHTRASLSFSGTSSGLSSKLSHSQGHTICPKTIAPFYCRNFCEFFSAPFVSSSPFTQEMCVTLLRIIALAGNLSSCSVWGTDYSWSCWRHLLSILPDHMAQPHVLTISANESSSYPPATLFMFYSIRLFQKFIQVFP